MPIAHRGKTLWVLAVVATLGLAAYQRLTGPTVPLRGSTALGSTAVSFKLPRSGVRQIDVPIVVPLVDGTVKGTLRYRRYLSNDTWSEKPFERTDAGLVAHLPHQPPAGKLMYFVLLEKGEERVSLSGEAPIILRYRGDVPAQVIVPHVILMFLAILLSMRCGLEALDSRGDPRRYLSWSVGCLLLGGFVFGPLLQKYAFGAYWTGVPFGWDLTDNKALVSLVGWLLAWYKNSGTRRSHGYLLFAAFLMVAMYLIPHSLLGSELDHRRESRAETVSSLPLRSRWTSTSWPG